MVGLTFDDDRYPAHQDTELSWRALLASHMLVYAPAAVVHYRLRERLWSLVGQHYRCGRAEPLLYRDFRSAGMPRSSCRRAIVVWAYLVLRAADRLVASRRGRRWWMRLAALRCGRLAGSLRHRVLYL